MIRRSGAATADPDSPPGAPAGRASGRRLLPRLTLRLRLAVLFGGLLAVVAVTLLGTAAVVLDRTIRTIPQFPPGQTLRLQDAAGRLRTVDAGDFARLLRDQARSDLLQAGGTAFAVVVLVGMVAGYVLAGRALQPVSEVTATARRLSTETLNERIALDGPEDELKELADTFDGMLGRLDAAFDSQRRFVANASHELRTPLAVIRTEVDVTLADANASVADLRAMAVVVRDASGRADRLVDALLVLARSEAQARIGPEVHEPVDLAAVVERAVDGVAAVVGQRCLAVTVEATPATTTGDPELLDRLVGNLVENAVRHNVDGGWVSVRTETVLATAGAPASILVVRNSGPPVAPEAVDGLFEPFRRGGRARTATPSRGAGLGLSIVRAVTAAHGGEVTARPGSSGGLEVTVRLPAG
ncbi:MAG TPA: HAMP domain-containing sensor histidine kinase [Mycobacteriales bacterium]|nr:HAMP domain-containing sensor histidine kinase [Mycobacteriales bacterium]